MINKSAYSADFGAMLKPNCKMQPSLRVKKEERKRHP